MIDDPAVCLGAHLQFRSGEKQAMRKASPTELEEALSAPREIVVDQSTARRLEELCFEMTDTCGHIEAALQLAVEDKSEGRVAYIKTALYLSARGTHAIKMFLSEWSVLVQESKIRENRPSAKAPIS